MHDSKKVYIFGYSGHSYVVIESMLELGFTILGYFDKKKAVLNPYHLQYLGFESNVDLRSIVKNDFVFPTMGDQYLRKKIVNLFILENLKQLTVVDKSANVSNSAIVGLSTYIGKNSIINALSKIGIGVIINSNAVIEHECEIGNFVHLGPSTTLTGNVKVGESSFVGAGSVSKQNIGIGSNCILGAGSVLLKNVPNGETWVGCPAKKIK